MAKAVTTLVRADVSSGVGKNGKNWLRTDFFTAGGDKYSTFDGNLASKANSLLNTPVELEFETNEQYRNNTLLGIEKVYVDDVAPQAPDQPAINPEPTYAHPPNKNDQFRTKEQIMRTDALQAVLAFSGIVGIPAADSVDEFHGWYTTFYKLIEEGVFETPDVRAEALAE